MANIQRVGKGFDLGGSLARFRLLKQTLPVKLANDSVNHFKEGFTKGGGKTDASIGGWKARKRSAPRNKGRALLVDTGALRRDIRPRDVSWNLIKIGAGYSSRTAKYASVHNRGLGKMPKREFIGESKVLRMKNRMRIKKEMFKVF